MKRDHYGMTKKRMAKVFKYILSKILSENISESLIPRKSHDGRVLCRERVYEKTVGNDMSRMSRIMKTWGSRSLFSQYFYHHFAYLLSSTFFIFFRSIILTMKEKRYFGMHRNVFFTGLTSFLTDISTKMVYSIMPMFLLSIGASKTTIALIEWVAESTAALVKVFSWRWSDRLGKNKPLMLAGYALTAIITPIYYFVGKPIHVLWLRFIERVGKWLRAAPRDSLISASINPWETGRSFGFHKAMDNSGAIVGPIIAAVFLAWYPWEYNTLFLIAAIPASLWVLSLILFVQERKEKTTRIQEQFSWKDLPKRYYFFLGIIFIFTLGNSTDALLIVRTTETGVDSMYVPLIYMLFNTVSVLFAIPLGTLSDSIGKERLILLWFLLFSGIYFWFWFFNSIWVFILLFILYWLYSALTDGSQKAMISEIVPSHLTWTAYGLYYAIIGITALPASFIAGTLYDRVNPSAAFFYGTAMAIIAALLLIVFMHYNKKYSSHGLSEA